MPARDVVWWNTAMAYGGDGAGGADERSCIDEAFHQFTVGDRKHTDSEEVLQIWNAILVINLEANAKIFRSLVGDATWPFSSAPDKDELNRLFGWVGILQSLEKLQRVEFLIYHCFAFNHCIIFMFHIDCFITNRDDCQNLQELPFTWSHPGEVTFWNILALLGIRRLGLQIFSSCAGLHLSTESKPNGHVSDSFTITTANRSPDYDKEMLKRTMLVHEATFRKQVYELHQLYKTQKDLMAQFQREECNVYPRSADTLQARSYSSQATSGDVKRAWQVMSPTSGYDITQSSINFGKGSEYAEESSSIKMQDFFGLGASTSQSQCYSSDRVNLNHLGLEENMKEKRTGEASDSNFFGANEEIKRNNSFNHKTDHQNVSMAWFKQEQSGGNFSAGHYLPRYNAFNKPITAPTSSISAVKSPWQSGSTSCTANGYYGSVYTPFAQNGFFNGVSMNSMNTPMATHYHNQQFPGEPQCRRHSPLHDVNLNDAPRDATAIQEQGSENSPVDPSWIRKDPVDQMKSQAQPSWANGQSQVLLGSTDYSGGCTRILGFPINAAAETNIEPLTKHEADMEIHKKDGINVRNLIDLNAAPFMDEPDLDVHQSEGETVPQQLDDPSEDSLARTAAESLVALCKDVLQEGSSLADTLHWFADLAIAPKEDGMVCSSESDRDDDFEALTLQLQETKGYELYLTPKTPVEHSSNEDHGSLAASLLQTKPRRGRARKRPQKKDFQKDILPGLASLSKHEVSDDLHTLGMSTPSKRGGRNGSQSRGRRRARSVAITVEEDEVSAVSAPVPPPLPPVDLDADALGITGWGRTTRRCRRPRCSPANNASLRLA
uniref:Uncharacterized protein n=1 Tax=Leersia perrieri TaxID=77586 RepID=A0A0D9W9Y2_9ORYZ